MADEDDRVDGEDRIFTIPNLLSVGRLLCIPLFLWLLFGKEDRARAAYLLGALGATDWVDGYVARHFNQVSTLGKVLDPTADRLLLGVGIVAILIDGSVPRWVAVGVLVREVLVAAAVVALAALGASRIDVTWFGKAGTFFNMFAFPLFLGGASGISWNDTARTLGWICAIPGLILSYYAALLYIPAARKALREGRGGRAPKVA
ncbi:MAG TPA: CDP-alcohol phosphatidyltransferase family protein [Acidimicrobiales bacterium]|jgi:cardiolipin synthase (CMP-forming)|nr:CDP-alcohol phosphatidyltransferase family protein [Acidimicrobiales bacterium]